MVRTYYTNESNTIDQFTKAIKEFMSVGYHICVHYLVCKGGQNDLHFTADCIERGALGSSV